MYSMNIANGEHRFIAHALPHKYCILAVLLQLMQVHVEWLANYQTPPMGHLSFLALRSVINAKFVMEIQIT